MVGEEGRPISYENRAPAEMPATAFNPKKPTRGGRKRLREGVAIGGVCSVLEKKMESVKGKGLKIENGITFSARKKRGRSKRKTKTPVRLSKNSGCGQSPGSVLSRKQSNQNLLGPKKGALTERL